MRRTSERHSRLVSNAGQPAVRGSTLFQASRVPAGGAGYKKVRTDGSCERRISRFGDCSIQHNHMSAFPLVIYVPLCQGMVMLIQWVTYVQPMIYDTTGAGLSDTFWGY